MLVYKPLYMRYKKDKMTCGRLASSTHPASPVVPSCGIPIWMMAFGLNEPNPSAIKGFGVWLTFSSLRATQNSTMMAAIVAMHETIETAQRFGLTTLYHLCF